MWILEHPQQVGFANLTASDCHALRICWLLFQVKSVRVRRPAAPSMIPARTVAGPHEHSSGCSRGGLTDPQPMGFATWCVVGRNQVIPGFWSRRLWGGSSFNREPAQVVLCIVQPTAMASNLLL